MLGLTIGGVFLSIYALRWVIDTLGSGFNRWALDSRNVAEIADYMSDDELTNIGRIKDSLGIASGLSSFLTGVALAAGWNVPSLSQVQRLERIDWKRATWVAEDLYVFLTPEQKRILKANRELVDIRFDNVERFHDAQNALFDSYALEAGTLGLGERPEDRWEWDYREGYFNRAAEWENMFAWRMAESVKWVSRPEYLSEGAWNVLLSGEERD